MMEEKNDYEENEKNESKAEDNDEECKNEPLYVNPNQDGKLDAIVGTEGNNVQKKYPSSKDLREERIRTMESWKDNS